MIYKIFTPKQLSKFLNKPVEEIELVELRDADLYGNFIIFEGYKFKLTYGNYQCLETPTQKIEKRNINFVKAKNDHYKKQ